MSTEVDRRTRMMDVAGLKCADLVNAMGSLPRHRSHILDLVSPTPGRILFGPAVTISYFPSCSAALDPERYNLANLYYEAVGDSAGTRATRRDHRAPERALGWPIHWRGFEPARASGPISRT